MGLGKSAAELFADLSKGDEMGRTFLLWCLVFHQII
jgi:hypothetical protein